MASSSAVPALPAIPSQIGRYKIVCELGQGGMGTIYLGRAEGQRGFERLTAIKMIHPHLSKQQSFINMFLDEARIAALIRHPNVVPVHEIGTHVGRHFIAMDYVSGEPLSVLLDSTWCRGRPLDVDLISHIVSIVCEALHAAHDLVDPNGRPLKVVHRDVCPQNVMLGYDGIVRVMDFGVAKAVDQLSQTRPGTHKGKVPYMAPEQIRCQSIDRRSDIFSLGVVLWESTIGKRLFKAENDILSASKVLLGKVPRPTMLRKDYPSELEEIIFKALDPAPDNRFQTAREMGEALCDFLDRRGADIAPSDVESLLKVSCANRHERRMEMERRAVTNDFDGGPIEEETIRLFGSGESNLPSFEVGPVDPKDALLSVASAHQRMEGADQATVRTNLEDYGFLGAADFALLEEDRDSPPTLVEDLGHEDSIRRLVRASERAVQPQELTPARELESAGGRRGVAVLAGTMFAVVLVAFGIASALKEEPRAAPPPPLAQEKVVAADFLPPVEARPEGIEAPVEPPPAAPREAPRVLFDVTFDEEKPKVAKRASRPKKKKHEARAKPDRRKDAQPERVLVGADDL